MQLELTELLVCPRCGPPHGLIAFVERMERRRIEAGHLDCPICEERHVIRGATVWFGGAAAPAIGDDVAIEASASGDRAVMATALLGAPASGETILFGSGAEAFAAAVAALRPDARVVSFGGAPSPPHERVHSLVAVEGREWPRSLPLRDGCLDGVVLRGDVAPRVAEAARVLRPGGRLVVLDPGSEEAAIPPDAPLEILAADPRAWVAARS
ncbi:MAG: hypothetical protein ACR2GQ_01350 [Gemmatimonadota bacterium]